MGWVLLLSLRFKSPSVQKWRCSKSNNITLQEYKWQLRWPRKKPLDRRSMIKASMVTDCRLSMYTTVASGGSARGHNAMFLLYGAGAPQSRMGNFRENYVVRPFPSSRDTGVEVNLSTLASVYYSKHFINWNKHITHIMPFTKLVVVQAWHSWSDFKNKVH